VIFCPEIEPINSRKSPILYQPMGVSFGAMTILLDLRLMAMYLEKNRMRGTDVALLK